MTEIEKLRAENVELVRACELALKICKFQIKQFDMEDGRYESWAKQIKYFKQALSSSPSAKWLEAVEKVINLSRKAKCTDTEGLLHADMHNALDELDALEKK